MPLPIAAKVSIAAVTVAVAAAVAIYESPEVRRVAEDLRRRIAIALRSLGDEFDPDRPPRFNRPEDADGFYESHEFDADEETRRRQREELMYWNARRNEQPQESGAPQPSGPPRLPTFDDFLRPASSGERGTLVFNTGANPAGGSNNVIRRRGNLEGVRGLNAAMVYNPFADEHGIEMEERPRINDGEAANLLRPGQDEIVSDIYSATPRSQSPEPVREISRPATAQEVLFDFDSQSDTNLREEFPDAYQQTQDGTCTSTTRSVTLGRDEADEEEHMSASNTSSQFDAYASVQAWAQHSNTGFYSPLPVTPEPPMSEDEFLSQGQRTPSDDTASVAESGVEVADDAASSKDGDYGIMSDSDDGIATPGSWSDVGSVISESESIARA